MDRRTNGQGPVGHGTSTQRAVERRHTLTGHTGWVRAVATTTIGETPVAVTGSNDGPVLVWDLDTGERRHTLTGHAGWVTAARRPGRRHRQHHGQVLVWDLDTGERRHTSGHTGWVTRSPPPPSARPRSPSPAATMGRSWSGTWTPANAGTP
ncbi:MAG: hypothetical protein U0Q21_01110 [Dermatophilaceae bacterium]